MITIGVDAHKRIHAAVALDETGHELAHWRGPNSAQGWHQLYDWAAQLGPCRQWGIEGAWNYGRGLAQFLVKTQETVLEINPRWTAQTRRRARQRDKSDRLDARAVASLVRQEGTTLPQVTCEDETAALDLLAREREDLLAEATRLRNQLHQLLFQIDPEYRQQWPSLQSQAALRALESYTVSHPAEMQQLRAAAVRRLGQRLRLVAEQITGLTAQIEARAQTRFAPLTELCGVNLLTAGTLAGILGLGRQFTSDAQLAAYAGVAPLEASSAGLVRHRLNRGGNRRLNAILYRIALPQSQRSPQAIAYLDRRLSEGKTRREALRALKRYLIRAIWRLWQKCRQAVTDAVSGTSHVVGRYPGTQLLT